MPVEQWKSSRVSLYQGKILIFRNMPRKTSLPSYTRLVKSCRGNICHTQILQHIFRMNFLQRARYRLPLPANRPRLWMSRWSWPQTGPGSGTRRRARIPPNPDESANGDCRRSVGSAEPIQPRAWQSANRRMSGSRGASVRMRDDARKARYNCYHIYRTHVGQ